MRARFLIIAMVSVGLAGCGSKTTTPDAPSNTGTGTTSSTISIMSLDPSGSSANDYDSNGKLTGGYGSTFNPTTLSVSSGTTVTWKNNDAVTHEPTSDTPGLFHSRLDPNNTFSVPFATPGTYTYHCNIHPELTGTITVK